MPSKGAGALGTKLWQGQGWRDTARRSGGALTKCHQLGPRRKRCSLGSAGQESGTTKAVLPAGAREDPPGPLRLWVAAGLPWLRAPLPAAPSQGLPCESAPLTRTLVTGSLGSGPAWVIQEPLLSAFLLRSAKPLFQIRSRSQVPRVRAQTYLLGATIQPTTGGR